jgi:hypothetical protein
MFFFYPSPSLQAMAKVSLSFAKTQSGLCFQSSPSGRSPFTSVVQSTDFSDLDHCP